MVFQDIFSVLRNPNSKKLLEKLLKQRYKYTEFDCVVGIESRGFIIAEMLSSVLEKGFIPIRKVDKTTATSKIPGVVETISYGTEYSKDSIAISKDFLPGMKVIICDDLIATGGSLKAAIDLVERVGGIVVDCCVIVEEPKFCDKARATLGRDYTVLLK